MSLVRRKSGGRRRRLAPLIPSRLRGGGGWAFQGGLEVEGETGEGTGKGPPGTRGSYHRCLETASKYFLRKREVT